MFSEIVQLRKNIAHEYMSAQLGLFGFASGMSRHNFITSRMLRMQEQHKELEKLVGDQAGAMLAETLASLPEQPTRLSILSILQRELSETENAVHLFDDIQDAWKLYDTLSARFGVETAQAIINAPSYSS